MALFFPEFKHCNQIDWVYIDSVEKKNNKYRADNLARVKKENKEKAL